MRCRINSFSLGLQETWRVGKEEITEDDYTFLDFVPNSQHGRGSCGVGILFCPTATIAWKAVGPDTLHNDLESRVIVVRLRVVNPATDQHLIIYMMSAYPPIFVAYGDIKSELEDSLATTIARRHFGDILIILSDANDSLGGINSNFLRNNNDALMFAIGPHELNYVNFACRRPRSFLEQRNLVTLSSFFFKKHYGIYTAEPSE